MSLKESIAAGHKILRDANLQGMAELIGCKFSEASAILQRNMAAATVTKPETLIIRQKAIAVLRNDTSFALGDHLNKAASIEEELTTTFCFSPLGLSGLP
jgi:hypothetical protein